ncbi:MAG: hypothetical protein LBE13_21215, partial [Bacteroidales bacterium]|nr:hypothetical protein [Bacteroidales bacterium]
MKNYLILAVGMLLAMPIIYSQKVTITENFDGNTVSFTSTPASAWERDTNYSKSPPYAYLGTVPNTPGGIITLETLPYDFTAYDYVLLRFKHICKISPRDIVRVEYKLSGQGWIPVPIFSYLGNASNYGIRGFNAGSYSEWKENDSIADPLASWWKEEAFDISPQVGTDNAVQFRFLIQHGNVPGTQISYGWLLDDIEIIASTYEVNIPTVEFIAPFVRGNVYSAGPFEINAKVKTRTSARIETPYLKYTAINNGISVSDSVPMTNVRGDSLWKANIPELARNTEVIYSIRGSDTNGNYASANSQYYIQPMEGGNYTDYSAAISSIDMKDTVVTSLNNPVSVPIIATIKSMGNLNLTSATIYYSINNGIPQQYNWTGNLAKDATKTDTLGYYNPRFEKIDVICVWVERPNGVTDSITHDDTLTKQIYGCGDIVMRFYNYLGDTVYSTGHHQVMADIQTFSGNIPTSVSLYIVATKDGISLHDTLSMSFDASQDLWIVTLPHYVVGSKVIYSITQTDYLANSVSIVDSFYILIANIPISETIYAPWGIGAISMNSCFFEPDEPTSWERHIYLASNIGADRQDMLITRIAWHIVSGDLGHVRTNYNIYMQVTSSTDNSQSIYIDPVANRAVLVYKGIMVTQLGWNEIILDRPFFVPQGSNLMIYFEDKTGYVSPPGGNNVFFSVGGFGNWIIGSNHGSISAGNADPAMRFTTGGWNATTDNHSVALETLNSPDSIEVPANVSVPVHVTIRNKGFANLTSCDINWAINGVMQTPYHYTGNLPEDFTDTATIGNYFPSNGTLDNLVVWVSMPNGVMDNVKSDDTLYMTTIACSNGGLSGDY